MERNKSIYFGGRMEEKIAHIMAADEKERI